MGISSGTLLDKRYRVDQPIGVGGFATVYSGFHLTLSAPVAIKVLHLAVLADAELRADVLDSFIEEARLVTRLRHDHVVRTLDQGLFHDESGHPTPYLVLEWCGDESLRQHLEARRGKPLPLEDAYAIVADIADGMAHAHKQGVVHRDLKPGNVMLARNHDGTMVPRIIDFGIAKVFEGEDGQAGNQTMTKSAGKFTPAYAAPEQLAGLRTGPWTDVHAIGLIFYELVTGRAPFDDGPSLRGIDPERPSPARLGIDVGAFEAVIARAVALRPTERHADAGELRDALQAAAREMTLPPPSRTKLIVAETRPKGLEAVARAELAVDTAAPMSRATEVGVQGRRWGLAAAVLALSVGATAIALWMGANGHEEKKSAASPVEDHASPPAPSPMIADVSKSQIIPASASASSSATHVTSVAPIAGTKSKPPLVVYTATVTSKPAEPVHAPSVTASKGVGGIVENPPF